MPSVAVVDLAVAVVDSLWLTTASIGGNILAVV